MKNKSDDAILCLYKSSLFYIIIGRRNMLSLNLILPQILNTELNIPSASDIM